jgi:predicted RNase H-like HicB family nuclease
MEVEMNKYIIKYEDGKSVSVTAKNLEEALEIFKEQKIETATKEIRVMSAWERYNKHKQRES